MPAVNSRGAYWVGGGGGGGAANGGIVELCYMVTMARDGSQVTQPLAWHAPGA